MNNKNTSNQWHHEEPWRLIMGGKIRDCREDVIHHVKDRARAIACVNALAGRDPSKLEALETALEDYIIAHEKWEADVILYDESGDPRTDPPRLTKELYEGAIVVRTKRHEALAALVAFRGESE